MHGNVSQPSSWEYRAQRHLDNLMRRTRWLLLHVDHRAALHLPEVHPARSPETTGSFHVVWLDALDIVWLRSSERRHEALQLTAERLRHRNGGRHLRDPIARAGASTVASFAPFLLVVHVRVAGVATELHRRTRCRFLSNHSEASLDWGTTKFRDNVMFKTAEND